MELHVVLVTCMYIHVAAIIMYMHFSLVIVDRYKFDV